MLELAVAVEPEELVEQAPFAELKRPGVLGLLRVGTVNLPRVDGRRL